MIVLALDTAMAGCSAAVYDAGKKRLLSERFIAMTRGHAEAIAPLVRDVMAEAAIGFAELGRVGVTIGPGTFTGVRAGLAMARGLGLSLAVPVVGIDTLTAIVCNAVGADAPVAVAADARRGEVYFAAFDRDLSLARQPAVLSVEAAAKCLPDGPAIVLGTAAEALIAAAVGKTLIRSNAGDLPRASAFAARLACIEPEPSPPEPLYLRPPDARPQERLADRRTAFEVHPASAGTANLLAALHGECFDNPWLAADMARLMATPGAVSLLASEGDEPLAFLIARQAADETEILTLGTRPFARRRGAARALVERLQSEIVGSGARSLFIEVASGNEPARRLYQQLGFTRAGMRKGYYERPGGAPEDAIVMRKDLVP